jgi:hypothetical protein
MEQTDFSSFVQTTNLDFVVIPDVHCRTFWKKAIEKYLLPVDTPMCTTRIVFLGDYVDGYPHEWYDDSYVTDGIDRLEEIIEIKKKHPHQVKLLLGNHDCAYAIGDEICTSRKDYAHEPRIARLFTDNRDCFQIMHKEKGVLFSHAGVHKGFLEDVDISKEHFVDIFNNAWLTENYEILDSLGRYDAYRGYRIYDYGSPVWADVRSFFDWAEDSMKPIDEGLGFQVFGHTQLSVPIITNNFACIDCRQALVIDEDKVFRDIETLKEVEKANICDEY